MPWIGSEALVETMTKVARLEAQLAAETNRRERAELELARLQDDFKSLVAITAGRIPPKLSPEFERDPWREDPRIPETFLTPALDEGEFTGEVAEEMIAKDNNGRAEGREV